MYQDTAEQIEKWDKHRVSWHADGNAYKIKDGFGYRIANGNKTHIFMRLDNNTYRLTQIIVFEDGTFQIGEEIMTLSMQALKKMFADEVLLCSPPPGATVCLSDLGTFEMTEAPLYCARSEEKLKEVLEMHNKLVGKEDAHDHCIKLYHQYLTHTDENARELLRKAYEAVPEHERIYLGDMDSRDSDYIRILYHSHIKREV